MEEIDQMLATISEGGFVDLRSYLKKSEALEDYQQKLVSGENIKTINNQSILGEGNIDIQGGGGGIEGITMNDSPVSVEAGVANLGTVVTDKSDKQDTLVSGTNIKTINNESILGSGNITIQGGGTDTGTVQTMIDQSISGKADSSTVTALTNTVTGHTADTSIHVTTAQTAAWDAKSNFSGSYNDLTDKPTIPTVPTSNTAFTNDAGYITNDTLSGYAESTAVTQEISAAVSGKTNQSDFSAHTANTSIHVTTTEKNTWNAKADVVMCTEAEWQNISGSTVNGTIYLVY
jgi:hypothetical protein